jgi:hypothetical protein
MPEVGARDDTEGSLQFDLYNSKAESQSSGIIGKSAVDPISWLIRESGAYSGCKDANNSSKPAPSGSKLKALVAGSSSRLGSTEGLVDMSLV